MRTFTWLSIVAAAVVIVPAWTAPAWLVVLAAVMVATTGVRALLGKEV